jgi:hypothetical protein
MRCSGINERNSGPTRKEGLGCRIKENEKRDRDEQEDEALLTEENRVAFILYAAKAAWKSGKDEAQKFVYLRKVEEGSAFFEFRLLMFFPSLLDVCRDRLRWGAVYRVGSFHYFSCVKRLNGRKKLFYP